MKRWRCVDCGAVHTMRPGEPLAGLLGGDRVDPGKPGREARAVPMARGGQPPAPAVLVARLSAAAPSNRGSGLVGRTAGAGGHRGHALDAISSSAAPAATIPTASLR